MCTQMFRCQLRHFTGSEDQSRTAAEPSKRCRRKLDCRIAHRYRAIGDARLRPHALARRNRTMKEQVEHRTRRPCFARNCIGFLHLRENLPLSEHQRIKARSNTEEMLDRRIINVGIEIFVQIIPALRQVVEKLPQCLAAAFVIIHGCIELRAVACGQHHQTAKTVIFSKTHQSRTQFLAGK